MKILLISDIHGSLDSLKKVLIAYETEMASQIIMLGDALYHGPRNELPIDYNPQKVAALLNEYKEHIIAVRGNCDSEVDQMLIDYPMMSVYSFILFNKRKVFLTHGHVYSPENLPSLQKGDIFAFGHTHLPEADYKDGIYILNPGSISIPKGGYPASYGILSHSDFTIKSIDGKVIKEINF